MERPEKVSNSLFTPECGKKGAGDSILNLQSEASLLGRRKHA